ncbi:MAG: hypothetical protein KatS3mg105_4437 [Gemmatales bacterium]|nr:MAG: hypothetical protein KatS3mg105_4437 [Gemmatales bacterium]
MSSQPAVNQRQLVLALVFASLFPTFTAWLYFLYLGGAANSWTQAAYTAGKLIQFAFPVVFCWVAQKQLPVNLCRPRSRGIILGSIFGLGVAAGIMILYFVGLRGFLERIGTPEAVRQKVVAFGADSPSRFFLLAVFLSVFHSFLEEYYWRWFVFGKLRSLVTIWPAVVISSLGFMAHHVLVLYVYLPGRFVSAVLPFSLCIAFGGGFWAWLYEHERDLYGPWLSHALVDAAIMTVGYHLVFP